MTATAPESQRDHEDTRSSRPPTSGHRRGAIHAQGGRRLAPLTLALTVGVVVVAALAAWALLMRSGANPTPSVPAHQPAHIAGQQSGLPDPAALSESVMVVEGYLESLNRGDTAGALAAFAPDAAFISPRCQPACIGTSVIAPVLENTVATHGQFTLTDPRVEGDTLTAHFSVASPDFPGDVQRVIGTITAVGRNQKIVLMSMNWDATDPQAATVLNASNQY